MKRSAYSRKSDLHRCQNTYYMPRAGYSDPPVLVRDNGSSPLRPEERFSIYRPLLVRKDSYKRNLLTHLVREEKIRDITDRLCRAEGSSKRRCPLVTPVLHHQDTRRFRWDQLPSFMDTLLRPIFDDLGRNRLNPKVPGNPNDILRDRSANLPQPQMGLYSPHQKPATFGLYHHVTTDASRPRSFRGGA